jgi:hypothetical protein
MNINKKLNAQAVRETGSGIEVFKSKNDNELYYKNTDNQLVNVMTDKIKAFNSYSDLPVEGIANTFYVIGEDIYMWNGTSYFSITTVPVTPSEIVEFNTEDPNLGGTVFTPDIQQASNTLYVSTDVDTTGQSWIWNSDTNLYDTYEVDIPDNTPFVLEGTSIDAGGNKVARIQRTGRITLDGSEGSYMLRLLNNRNSGVGAGLYIFRNSGQTSGYGLRIVKGTVNQLRVEDDGSLLINDAYTLPNVDGTAGQYLQTSGAGVVSWNTITIGGKIGISNSSGIYTYYNTLTDAMTAAVSGNTIELFTNITETGNVTVTHKNGVIINGNGYTYTLNVDNTADALYNNDANFYGEIYNLRVIRTGRTLGTTTGLALNYGPGQPTAILKCFNVHITNTYGRGVEGRAKFYGLHVIAYLDGIRNISGGGIYDSYAESTSNGRAIYSNVDVYNSVGISVSGFGIDCATAYSCTGKSTSGTGIQATNKAFNCIGISVSGAGFVSTDCYSCYGYSSTNYAFSACNVYNSSGISASSRAFNQSLGSYHAKNSYLESSGSWVVTSNNSGTITNCSVKCLWNNAGGHGVYLSVGTGFITVSNNTIEVINTSAYCISGGTTSAKYSNNSFSGSTTPINPTITQLITNTSDNQGNILI